MMCAGCTRQQVLGRIWHDLLGMGENCSSEGFGDFVEFGRFGGSLNAEKDRYLARNKQPAN